MGNGGQPHIFTFSLPVEPWTTISTQYIKILERAIAPRMDGQVGLL